ncbi:MAG: hypothetical protein AB1696_29245 [Planctomycetota bacterium]
MMELLTNPPGCIGWFGLIAAALVGAIAVVCVVMNLRLRRRINQAAADVSALNEKLNEGQESLSKKIDLAMLSLTQTVDEVKSSVPAQLDEARTEMNRVVDEKVSTAQNALTRKIEETELSVAQTVAGVESRVEQVKAEAESALERKLSETRTAVEQRLKEAENVLDHRMSDLETSAMKKAEEASASAGSARAAAEEARRQAADVMDRLTRFEEYFRTVFEAKFSSSFAHFDQTVVDVLGHMREELQRGLNRVDQMHAMVENRARTEGELLATQQEAQQLLAEGEGDASPNTAEGPTGATS